MKKILLIIGVIIFGAGMFFAGYMARNYTDPDLASLKFILDKYKDYYLEEDNDYLEIMVDGLLDKYSNYYTKEEYELIKKSAKGVRSGVGITTSNHQGEAFISAVAGNSPAEIAGVTCGGYITGIKKTDETNFQPVDYQTCSSKMKEVGDGENFILQIRYGESVKEFSLVKREYTESYVYYSDCVGSYRFSDGGGSTITLEKYTADLGVVLPEDTAYLKYRSFNGNRGDLYGSVKQISTVMNKFKSDGRSKIIIDLRGNGGGFMDIMCDVVAHFIGADSKTTPKVSYALYKDGTEERFNSASVKYNDYGYKGIVILADENTASASEAFIGACLDYDKNRNVVKVVLSRNSNGQYKTYGKGIMQTTFENLTVGDAIKLTTAKIYWPVSNISIHDVGITKNLAGYEGKIFEAPYQENADYELIHALSLV